MTFTRSFFFAFLGLALSLSLSAQVQASTITISVYNDADNSGALGDGDSPAPESKVSLQRVPGNEEVAVATVDEDGNVTFEDVPPGNYRLVITSAGGVSITTNEFVVESGVESYAFAIPLSDATNPPFFAVLQVLNPASIRGAEMSPAAP